jgi:hypothetical protein
MADADLVAPAGTNLVYISAFFTAARTLVIPPSTGYAVGDSILVTDPNGCVGGTTGLAVAPTGADTINGANTWLWLFNGPRRSCRLVVGYSGGWGTDDNRYGITNGSNAITGEVGEVVLASRAIGAGVAIVNAVTINVTSIALTAGDWDVSGQNGYQANGTVNLSALAGGCTSVSAGFPPDEQSTLLRYPASSLGGGNTFFLPFPTTRFNLTAPATIYLTALVLFAGGGTMLASGLIRARRMR